MDDAFKLECSLCGAKIKAGRNLAGKTIACPACHQNAKAVARSTGVTGESRSIESDDNVVVMTPLVPIESVVKQEKLAIGNFEIVERPRAAAPAKRRLNQKAITAAGVVVACLLAASVSTAILLKQPSGGGDLREAAPSSPKGVAVVKKASTFTEVDALIIPEFKDYVTGFIKDQEHKSTNISIVDIAKQRVDDKRKIDWLWEVEATVSYTAEPPTPSEAPERIAYSWKGLVRSTPRFGLHEYWREVTEIRTGERTRRHFDKTEWKKEFRDPVRQSWILVNKKLQEAFQKTTLYDFQKKEFLNKAKLGVAKDFGISVDELNEICEAIE